MKQEEEEVVMYPRQHVTTLCLQDFGFYKLKHSFEVHRNSELHLAIKVLHQVEVRNAKSGISLHLTSNIQGVHHVLL